MTDSEIRIGDTVMSFSGPDATNLFRAITLRSALKLHQVGIKATRGITATKLFAMTKEYTGKDYKRGQYNDAIADLTVWIETMKLALPITRH
jgi:hypothetical protein